ncbi:PIN domain-containing protein [Roseiarcus fermentans]|uniref:PIN domain-containing protein n=1 Tax=Roseiarcus fermentans TaxID=1473586 RepID=UPI00247A8D92|nr:PIN domain-containing protein [Roseiarcus fermentans]
MSAGIGAAPGRQYASLFRQSFERTTRRGSRGHAARFRRYARRRKVLGRLLKAAGAAGNLTTDAHLAALALEQNATLVSFDRDFARFEGLRWTLPKPG